MPIAGQKEIFAVEWKFHSTDGKYIFAHLQYWGGGIPIGDWKDTVVYTAVVTEHQKYLCNIENFGSPVDCSNFSKEYLFHATHDYTDENKCVEKYFEFYRLARVAMMIHKGYNNSDASHVYEFASSDSGFEEDGELALWISNIFSIANLGFYALVDHVKLYFFQDVSKNQERLIWKNIIQYLYDKYYPDTFNEVILSSRVFEAVMPLGYFKKTIAEFICVASEEIAEIRKQQNK